MRKMILSAALACLCGLLTVDAAMACHGGYGGWGGCGWSGCGWGWGGGYYGGGYYGGDYCGGGYYVGGYYGGGYVVAAPAPATLVVSLPADAVLTIDGKRTTSTSSRRVFHTPALETGSNFQYTLEAKVVRDGAERVIKKRVTVRAGQQTSVRLEVPTRVASR